MLPFTHTPTQGSKLFHARHGDGTTLVLDVAHRSMGVGTFEPRENALWKSGYPVPVGPANYNLRDNAKGPPVKTEDEVRHDVQEENKRRIAHGQAPWAVEERVQGRIKRLNEVRENAAKRKQKAKKRKQKKQKKK